LTKSEECTTHYYLDSFFIDKNLTSAYQFTLKNIDRNSFGESDRHLNIYTNEIPIKYDEGLFDGYDNEELPNYVEIGTVLHLGREFETNNILNDDKGIKLLCGEFVKSMDLEILDDFSYALDNEIVIRYYKWNDHYIDHGDLFMIKKDILDRYLLKENKNLIFDIRDERSYYKESGKYSDKRKYLFYQDKNKINATKLRINASKMINIMGIEQFEEYVKAYRYFELENNESHEEEEALLGLVLIKNYIERCKRYNPININFIPILEDKNEDPL
jgi:hypothetical protein